MGDNIEEWLGKDFASLSRAAEDKDRCKVICSAQTTLQGCRINKARLVFQNSLKKIIPVIYHISLGFQNSSLYDALQRRNSAT